MLELEVPFVEKEQAKNLGARWNPVRKKWYVPDGLDINIFNRWWPAEVEGNNDKATLSLVTKENANSIEVSDFLEQQEESKVKQKLLLSEFLQNVSTIIYKAIPGMHWIVAEISEIKRYKSGYFLTLVEYENEIKNAEARANIWQSQEDSTIKKFKKTTKSELEPGIKVLVLVSANFHVQYGFSLSIHDIDPAYTLGNMAAKLEKIRGTLKSERIADKNKFLPSPVDFTRVAVISPEQAAGLGDFQREANILSKHGLCEFLYFTAVFQGKSAPQSILQSLKKAFAAHEKKPFNAIVIIRGGGAIADLAWLNDLELARACCLAPVKIMAGIGHERDYTIIDEVAGLKFDTPSKVIGYIFQLIINNAEKAEQNFTEISNFCKSIILQMEYKVNTLREKMHSTVFKYLAVEENNLNVLIKEVYRLAPKVCDMATSGTEQLFKEIIALGPNAIQKKGFVVVKTSDNNLITSSVEAAKYNDVPVCLQFHDGNVKAKIL